MRGDRDEMATPPESAGNVAAAAAEDESKTPRKSKKKASGSGSLKKFFSAVKSRTKSAGKDEDLEVTERAASDSAAAAEGGQGGQGEEKQAGGYKVLEGMTKGGSSMAAAVATPGRGVRSKGFEMPAGGQAAVSVADTTATKAKDSAEAPPTPDIAAKKAVGALEVDDSAEELEPSSEQKQQQPEEQQEKQQEKLQEQHQVQEATVHASTDERNVEAPTEEAEAEQPKKKERSPRRLRKGKLFSAVGIALGVIFIAMRLVAK